MLSVSLIFVLERMIAQAVSAEPDRAISTGVASSPRASRSKACCSTSWGGRTMALLRFLVSVSWRVSPSPSSPV